MRMRSGSMYESYKDKSNEALQTGASVMQRRISIAVIIVLLGSVIALGILGGRAMFYRSEARSLFISTIQTESNESVSLVNSLSRTAGTNSSATLGRIRANVRTVETANRLYGSLEGGKTLLPAEIFTELYTILENYSSRLQTGMNTGDLQGDLLAKLEEMQALAAALR